MNAKNGCGREHPRELIRHILYWCTKYSPRRFRSTKHTNLTYIADIPDLKKPIDMNLLRSMALRVPALETAATSTNMKSQGSENNDLMNFVTQKIADDIIAAQRAALIVSTGNGETEFDNLLTDLENMPTSDVTRKRIAQERRYVGSSSAVASRFASAHPMYYRHVADALEN